MLPKPGQSADGRGVRWISTGAFFCSLSLWGSERFGLVRKASDQILQEETKQTKGKATEMFSPPAGGF